MTPHPALLIKKVFLQAWLGWFQGDFRQNIVSLIEAQFPGYPLPGEIRAVLEHWEKIWQLVDATKSESINLVHLFENQPAGESVGLLLFKQMILRCRRQRAAYTEGLREKTFHPGLTQTLDEEINTLDAVVETEWFEKIGLWRLPRAEDFLPIQYIE